MLNLSTMDLLIPSLDMEGNTIKNTISWKTLGLNGKYSLQNNKINVNGGLSYIRNKSLTTFSSIFNFILN